MKKIHIMRGNPTVFTRRSWRTVLQWILQMLTSVSSSFSLLLFHSSEKSLWIQMFSCWTYIWVPCFFYLFSFGLTPKSYFCFFTQARQSYFPRFVSLVSRPDVAAPCHAHDGSRWGRCAVKHVLASHILSSFFSSSSLICSNLIKWAFKLVFFLNFKS